MKFNISVSRMLCLTFFVAMSGCTTMLKKAEIDLPPGTPQYVVEMKGEGWSQDSEFRGALEGPMTIEDVLVASKAKQKFRDMDIDIIRVSKETGRPHKMAVEYKAARKKVNPQNDYAIQPNDRIVIHQKVSTPLDQMVDSFFPGR